MSTALLQELTVRISEQTPWEELVISPRLYLSQEAIEFVPLGTCSTQSLDARDAALLNGTYRETVWDELLRLKRQKGSANWEREFPVLQSYLRTVYAKDGRQAAIRFSANFGGSIHPIERHWASPQYTCDLPTPYLAWLHDFFNHTKSAFVSKRICDDGVKVNKKYISLTWDGMAGTPGFGLHCGWYYGAQEPVQRSEVLRWSKSEFQQFADKSNLFSGFGDVFIQLLDGPFLPLCPLGEWKGQKGVDLLPFFVTIQHRLRTCRECLRQNKECKWTAQISDPKQHCDGCTGECEVFVPVVTFSDKEGKHDTLHTKLMELGFLVAPDGTHAWKACVRAAMANVLVMYTGMVSTQFLPSLKAEEKVHLSS